MKLATLITLAFAAHLIAADMEMLHLEPAANMERADLCYETPLANPRAVLILCPGSNGNAEKSIRSSAWQAFAHSNNVGLVGLSFASSLEHIHDGTGYYYASKGSGDKLLEGIHKIYGKDLPLLLYGFSGGAHFTSRLEEWKPDRVLIWCAYSAEWWDMPRHNVQKGISSPSDLQGVMSICILYDGIEGTRYHMQQPELDGDYHGLFQYANEHKMAVLAWGGPGRIWDGKKNYNEMDQNAFRNMESRLDDIADTWEKGVLELSEKYGIPKKDFLQWGVCASAQWAHRICLRKPDYFLATYLLIPGSFDQPTPGGSKVLWCFCTGEKYGGYERGLRWYKECREMGYPMIFKAYEGLGHNTQNCQALGMAFKFFDFALTQKALRDQYNAVGQSRVASFQYANAGKDGLSWSPAFQKPLFYGDIVNQEVYPADQMDMIPAGFRTPLPTKELADYWGVNK